MGIVAVWPSWLTLFAAFSTFMLVTSALELRWRIFGWRTPQARAEMAFPAAVARDRARRSFSLIVPALDEPHVIGDTIRTLVRQTHPRVQVVVSLVEGDEATVRQARLAAAGSPRVELVVRRYAERSKPMQLNAALGVCTGDYVGVFDAEDDVAVDLLLHVEALIDETGADVIQGGVQLVNLDLRPPPGASVWRRLVTRLRGWYCVHNAMEYFFWFSSRMFYQVRQGFVPLGGNTVFVRRELLTELDGWPLNLTEDCALGVALSVDHDVTVVAAYEPRLATREETPARLFGPGSLDRQRRRWTQGFLSVLLQGSWRRLPGVRQRLMALYILAMPFIQAVNGVMLPACVAAAILLNAPVGWVLWMFTPFIPIAITTSLQLVGLREFAGQYGRTAAPRHYVSLVLGAFPYQLVLAWSAVMGLRRHLAGQAGWLKTSHDGLHRRTPARRRVPMVRPEPVPAGRPGAAE
ncbi:glycosyltransferase family 2 protein [Spirilliplanes yamanashiensis]|uniref:glycosyltransferase family 2 protein n=1 Tax=Spirilliplanes yamanashiensis TaxID=42233 RepID=UPI00194F21F9|nr:glycosyltransferase [Spirilliplanes yamanashiensis]MDP9815705.1 cellulose synthase/poly-beta-1,6-N-acetylglucosamine synthase-like glycosyltransferase [Spirilliplanes yamanashiensis]